jgi:hypothetical protein
MAQRSYFTFDEILSFQKVASVFREIDTPESIQNLLTFATELHNSKMADEVKNVFVKFFDIAKPILLDEQNIFSLAWWDVLIQRIDEMTFYVFNHHIDEIVLQTNLQTIDYTNWGESVQTHLNNIRGVINQIEESLELPQQEQSIRHSMIRLLRFLSIVDFKLSA